MSYTSASKHLMSSVTVSPLALDSITDTYKFDRLCVWIETKEKVGKNLALEDGMTHVLVPLPPPPSPGKCSIF